MDDRQLDENVIARSDLDPKVAAVFADPLFPFTTDLTIKPLATRVIPEPPRVGEGGVDCPACAAPDTNYFWTDESWRLRAYRPTPIAGLVILEPRVHVDSFLDFDDELGATIGPMIARVERAVLSIGDIARVHVNKIGDGGEHFHLWFMPRPRGALQLRGSPFSLWLDVLPSLPDEQVDAALDAIARALG